MTYVVRMQWAINYRMGYLVHKLGSIQKPRFTVVRKISKTKFTYNGLIIIWLDPSNLQIISKNLLLTNITFKNNFFERQILQTTVPKYIVIVLCVIKPAGKIQPRDRP